MTYLFEYGAKKIYLCSRTLAHAKELLAVHENLTVVDYHERYDVMKQCETVVSATSSPHLLFCMTNGKRRVPHKCSFWIWHHRGILTAGYKKFGGAVD